MTQDARLDRILDDSSLSNDEKIEKLKKLKYELERLSVATEENMPDLRPDNERSPGLRQVVLALESLRYTDDPSDAK